ncbi:NAD(P)/FAD-dependent oxidoreductase [Nesterenkonia xinjiangensis]|uniref:NADPH-dependent 2,4-dienoyl-CoA reductase/sulfur reductase-like enzyme n=1 Tax=Nesterenkonia xinjiangensis TaxID=225327 RepID=A0A7Z0KAM4_9MICC|nr:NAD(P)/FAD-dependent oxidoreductase [Nesterenkonia xinjiangensis]NYJ76762.1 NADPH-dependent 2,4-dienoyl-CoA reductase/sulfur reductase-like enzyme [Nesterenkonia xinjiangensis]
MTSSTGPQPLDTLVIGAGPAGIGSALALDAVEGLVAGVVDRGEIGETFHRWPRRQQFLTPSFTGNGYGATDLNSVHPLTSPAFSLGVDYPDGAGYAKYLRSVTGHFEIPVARGCEVTSLRQDDVGFIATTANGPIPARTVIWAGGEFQSPEVPQIPGRHSLVHTGREEAWTPREGRVLVLGGGESGIDIACHHIEHGAAVTVLDADHPWDAGQGSDPSYGLAPRSRMRLAAARETGRLTLASRRAVAVAREGRCWTVTLDDGGTLTADSPPLAGTGFGPGLGPAAHLFDRREDGWPLVDADDQSTLAPGLFLSGPALRHGAQRFCFIYKFRQRFAHVARVIGESLGKDCSELEAWRSAGMLAEDVSECGAECAC